MTSPQPTTAVMKGRVRIVQAADGRRWNALAQRQLKAQQGGDHELLQRAQLALSRQPERGHGQGDLVSDKAQHGGQRIVAVVQGGVKADIGAKVYELWDDETDVIRQAGREAADCSRSGAHDCQSSHGVGRVGDELHLLSSVGLADLSGKASRDDHCQPGLALIEQMAQGLRAVHLELDAQFFGVVQGGDQLAAQTAAIKVQNDHGLLIDAPFDGLGHQD